MNITTQKYVIELIIWNMFQRKYITGHGSNNFKLLLIFCLVRIMIMITSGIMKITVTGTAVIIVNMLITMKLTLTMVALAKSVIIAMIFGDASKGDK